MKAIFRGRNCGAERRRAPWTVYLLLVALLFSLAPGGVDAGRDVGPANPAAAAPAPAPAYAAPPPVSLQLRPQQAATATPTLEQWMLQLDAAWNAQNWEQALVIIGQIKAIDPNYDDIVNKEYFAHVNYGYQLMTQGNCSPALAQFNAALAIKPAGEEALSGLNLLKVYCPTPAPTAPTATPTPLGAVTPTRTPGPVTTLTLAPTITGTPSITLTPGVAISSPITYVVQPGDTLFSLAKKYGVTIQALMQANGMMSYFLRAGDVLWIPVSGAPPPGPVVHIVQPGETLNSLARQYNTTVWAIISANNLTRYSLYAYQALFIPTLQQPGPLIHIVWPGETLYTIAQKYGKTVTELMMANNLRTYELYVYQRVIIPPVGYTGWPMGWPESPGNPLPPFGSRTYTVQAGDTLFGVARKFGTTVEALKAANGLRSSAIYVGMKLKIP